MSVYCESGGFKAYVDGWLAEYSELYCVSLFGNVGAVKAVSARFLSGEDIQIAHGGVSVHFWRKRGFKGSGGMGKYRMMTKRLPSGLLSMVVVLEAALFSEEQEFVIINRDIENPVHLLFGNLVCRSEIPLHQKWSFWLWDEFMKNGWMTRLEGYRMVGYKVRLDNEELAELVSEGIKSGRIPGVEVEESK